jgi:hypothetical protein
MPRFMCQHTLPPHAVTKDQVLQMAEALRSDPKVRSYRGFFNLSEGKIFCIMESPDQATVANWFKKMNMPYDSIVEVELEGEYGMIKDARQMATAGA